MMTNSQPDFDLPTTATSTDKTFENAYDNSTLPAENPKPMRAIQTFMKRKTHVGKRAEAGLTADYAEFFIQKSANFSGSGVIDNAFENMAIDGIDNLRQYFANPNAPITLEIGFGMGGSLVEMASASPERNFVGIEVHEAGLGNCAFLAKGLGLSNLKLICGDAIGLLQQLPAEHLDTVQLYFPDPWQKKRHYKRRFVTAERMQIVARVLKSGGIFHAATDWEHYAFWMVAVLDAMPEFRNLAATTANAGSDFIPRPDFRPLTKFEKRGIEEGRGIWDVMYKKR